MRWLCLLTLLLLVPGAGGCAAYHGGFRYKPHPVEIIESTDAHRLARVLISVTGLRYEDEDANRPAGMELAVRVENLAADTAAFDPANLALLSADLKPFPRPIVDPSDPVSLARGQSANFTALFPLTAEVNARTADLTGLNVRLNYRVNDRDIERSATFQRLADDYGYHDQYHPHWRGHILFGYCD